MTFDRFLESLASPALRVIAAHWNEARGPAAMPSWEQLKPSRMAPHLSILWAYKFDAATGQFTGRLAGDMVTWGMPINFRGASLGDLWPPDTAPGVHRKMLRMISEPAICRKTGALFRHGGHLIEGQRMVLPLASDGVHGAGLLGASAYKHPLRNLDLGEVELLDSDDVEWFPVTPRTGRVAALKQTG